MSLCFSLCRSIQVSRLENKLENMLSFSPPSPSYEISSAIQHRQHQRGALYSSAKFISFIYNDIAVPYLKTECYTLKKIHDQNNRIVLLRIINKTQNKNKYTIIYSHGSASDLGTSYPLLLDLSTVLKCDIISYDYSGYGCSNGIASNEMGYDDIEQVLDFCIVNLSIDITDIFLFGVSIGSSPSMYIAAQNKYGLVKGIIGGSPISSGYSLTQEDTANSSGSEGKGRNKSEVSMTTKERNKIDVGNSLQFSEDIIAPVLLIHGKDDKVISYKESLKGSKGGKESVNWYPDKGTHTNIISSYRVMFYNKIKMFIKEAINHTKKAMTNKDISV